MFLGTFERKLDSSYRFRLPKELLRELSPGSHKSFPCLSIFGECLVVYPPKRFRQLVENFSAFELSNPEHRQLARDLFANIENCKVDSTGRMTLPEHSRNSAGISFDVVLVGAGKYFEIWSKERFRAHRSSSGESSSKNLSGSVLSI